jgi:hypothetical protein
MMGITVDEPAFVFGDNQSIFANTTAPASTLKKKSNAIAYHFVREGCARDEWWTAYININTHDNIADLPTKPLPSGEKQIKFIQSYYITFEVERERIMTNFGSNLFLLTQ